MKRDDRANGSPAYIDRIECIEYKGASPPADRRRLRVLDRGRSQSVGVATPSGRHDLLTVCNASIALIVQEVLARER